MNAPTNLPEIDVVFTILSPHRPGALGALLTVIGEEGAIVGDVKTLYIGKTRSKREITISLMSIDDVDRLRAAINTRSPAQVLTVTDVVFDRHRGGKIASRTTAQLEGVNDMRLIYTPGVARVCLEIADKPESARDYTSIPHTVGIFTNGTRVLGLGDIGPVASMPVMEGKAAIYDRFVGLSAVPVLIDTKDPDEFIDTVVRVAPTFGGIHLEDIRVPDCFKIEDELIRRLDKPVMHDDQHGTATVTLAAVLSALRIIGKTGVDSVKVTQVGLGAAGIGIARLMLHYGFRVTGVDPLPEAQQRILDSGGQVGELGTATSEADVVVATTGVVGLITPEMIRPGQIILALSNPAAEISVNDAINAGAALAGDGRVINNALAFPGLFKAAMDMGAKAITPDMKVAAAEAISELSDPASDELVPSPFHPDVHEHVMLRVKNQLETV